VCGRNTVHITRGTVSGTRGLAPSELEYTNWACVKVPTMRGRSGGGATLNASSEALGPHSEVGPLFYFRTYDNMQWKRVDLGRIDWQAGSKHAPIPLYEPGLGVRDVTPGKE